MAYIFSFKPVDELKALIAAHEAAPHQRSLQKALAEELTTMVHSAEDLHFAQQASQILFGGAAVEALRTLNEQQLLEVMEGVPKVHVSKDLLNDGFDFLAFLSEQKIFPSKGEARKMIAGGGLSINKEKVTPDFALTPAHLLNERYLLIQKGKSNYTLAVFE
jgi:tyrosyl-tRNA synthetase